MVFSDKLYQSAKRFSRKDTRLNEHSGRPVAQTAKRV